MSAAFNYKDFPNSTHASWWKDAGLRAGMLRIVILYSAVYSLGYDGVAELQGLQALTPWARYFGAPKGTSLGLIAATYYLPKIPASFIIPYIADRWGRKVPLYMGAGFMLVGAIVGGLANGRAMLMGSRILLGIGTAAGQIAASSLVPELAHPRIRHMAGSFLYTTYYIGSIFAAWLTFAMVYWKGSNQSFAWRIPTFVQGLGPLLLLIGTYFVPQSPRWLVKQGRAAEAHVILAKYHSNGKMDDPLVLMELKEIEAAVAMEDLSNSSSWSVFFNTPGGRRRLAIIFLLGTATQWAGNGVISYFLSPILKQVGITKPAQIAGINGGLAIWNWTISMTGAGLVDRLGRRPLFLISLCGMLACMSVMAGVSGGYSLTKVAATGVAIVPSIFLFQGSYSLAFTPLPVMYVPEISPLAMRAKAAAMLVLAQNIAQAFNQFVNPVALTAIGWKYYLVYLAVLVFYLATFYFYIRETRGLTTEEAAVVYDPSDAKDAGLVAEQKLREAAEMAVKDKIDGSIDYKERV